MFVNVGIILMSLIASSTAHVVLKKGMSAAQYYPFEDRLVYFWSVATNPWIVGGMFLHVSALIIWLWALSRVDISFAYPFLALGYVLVSLMAWLWLGEQITLHKILGMSIIVVGILVLCLSEGAKQ